MPQIEEEKAIPTPILYFLRINTSGLPMLIDWIHILDDLKYLINWCLCKPLITHGLAEMWPSNLRQQVHIFVARRQVDKAKAKI